MFIVCKSIHTIHQALDSSLLKLFIKAIWSIMSIHDTEWNVCYERAEDDYYSDDAWYASVNWKIQSTYIAARIFEFIFLMNAWAGSNGCKCAWRNSCWHWTQHWHSADEALIHSSSITWIAKVAQSENCSECCPSSYATCPSKKAYDMGLQNLYLLSYHHGLCEFINFVSIVVIKASPAS